MLIKRIKYTDYDGNAREEEFRFNLSRAECVEMNVRYPGGLRAYMNRIIDEQDNRKLLTLFKELVLRSYGVKSDDGKRFAKSPELSRGFEQTEAYSELVMELIGTPGAAAAFVNGVIPDFAGLADAAQPVLAPA